MIPTISERETPSNLSGGGGVGGVPKALRLFCASVHKVTVSSCSSSTVSSTVSSSSSSSSHQAREHDFFLSHWRVKHWARPFGVRDAPSCRHAHYCYDEKLYFATRSSSELGAPPLRPGVVGMRGSLAVRSLAMQDIDTSPLPPPVRLDGMEESLRTRFRVNIDAERGHFFR